MLGLWWGAVPGEHALGRSLPGCSGCCSPFGSTCTVLCAAAVYVSAGPWQLYGAHGWLTLVAGGWCQLRVLVLVLMLVAVLRWQALPGGPMCRDHVLCVALPCRGGSGKLW